MKEEFQPGLEFLKSAEKHMGSGPDSRDWDQYNNPDKTQPKLHQIEYQLATMDTSDKKAVDKAIADLEKIIQNSSKGRRQKAERLLSQLKNN